MVTFKKLLKCYIIPNFEGFNQQYFIFSGNQLKIGFGGIQAKVIKTGYLQLNAVNFMVILLVFCYPKLITNS